MFKKLKYTEFIVFLLLTIITCVWLYKLSLFPGLHADEAWFGIRANELNKGGAFKWHGMNHYSGSLQEMLSAISFKLLGKGIYQLRIGGLICNTCALVLFVKTLRDIFANRQVAVIFLLLLAQSSAWLVYPRIAWEVTSLTLLFLSISLWASQQIIKGNYDYYYIVVFLVIHLIGSYNHIIFASIPLSMLVTAIAFGMIGGRFDIKLFLLTLFNILDIVLLYFLMHYKEGYFFDEHLIPTVLGLFFIVMVEALVILKTRDKIVFLNILWTRRFPVCIKLFLIAGVCLFIWNHGIAFFYFLCNFKILQHLYSFESPISMIVFNYTFVVAFLFFLISTAVIDLINFSSLPVVFIFSYLSIFSLFTIANSPRYYLCISILIFLYAAYLIYNLPWKTLWKLGLLVFMALISQAQLWKIYTDKNYQFTPKYVSFGKNEEPSFHFFPIQSVTDYLRIHKIGKVQTFSNDYFIKTPIQFIESICPWERDMSKKVIIDYSETGANGGFIILEKN